MKGSNAKPTMKHIYAPTWRDKGGNAYTSNRCQQCGELESHENHATARRIKTFVDWFIRSDYVSNWSAEKENDFINEPERAARCYDAAKDGGDGSTHAEIIEDWREAFRAWIRGKRKFNDPERFMRAVEDYFDEVEEWHQKNGSLDEQRG